VGLVGFTRLIRCPILCRSRADECFIRLSQEEAFQKSDEAGQDDLLKRLQQGGSGFNLLMDSKDDALVPADAQAEGKRAHREHRPNYIGFFVVWPTVRSATRVGSSAGSDAGPVFDLFRATRQGHCRN